MLIDFHTDFGRAASSHAAAIGKSDPRFWTMQGYVRGPDNSYDDADLADILKDATEHIAGAFGANGTPAALKVLDFMTSDRDVCLSSCSVGHRGHGTTHGSK